MATQIVITVGENGISVEAPIPPVSAIGVLELAKQILIKQMSEPASPIAAPSGADVARIVKG